MTVHALLDCRDKCLHFAGLALGFEVHAPIGQVDDEAGHLELSRHLQHRITEADTLHVPGEKCCLVMNFRHEKMGMITGVDKPVQSAKFLLEKPIHSRFFVAFTRF